MPRTTLRTLTAGSTLALATILTGCSSSGTDGVAAQAVYQTPQGLAIVDTFITVATITAVDTSSRKISMKTPDGKSSSYKASKGVDLTAFRVGEDIGVQISDETILSIRTDGAPPRDAVATQLAAAGDRQGNAVFEGEAVEVSATVSAVDPNTRKVTLTFEDGSTKTIKAQSGVDLTTLKIGTSVTAQYAVSVIVAAVAKPSVKP